MVELDYLGWSVVLLLVHIIVQATLASNELGFSYAASARDEDRVPTSSYALRAYRALWNFLETYPAFIALALSLILANRAGGMAATGALVWLGARAVYLPVYLLGIAYLRTIVWAISLVGLVMMLVQFMGWA